MGEFTQVFEDVTQADILRDLCAHFDAVEPPLLNRNVLAWLGIQISLLGQDMGNYACSEYDGDGVKRGLDWLLSLSEAYLRVSKLEPDVEVGWLWLDLARRESELRGSNPKGKEG